MYFYIKGIITYIDINYVVIDCNNIGYMVYTANPYKFKLNKEYTVYIYQQIKEDDNTLFGFNSLDEKDLFIKLIGVKGLGCKMAITVLSDDINNIYSAIEKGDVSYLKKFPKIGDKLARQIILDLKGKLALNNENNNAEDENLIEALKSFGYKINDIKKVTGRIDSNKSLEEKIKDALKLLLK